MTAHYLIAGLRIALPKGPARRSFGRALEPFTAPEAAPETSAEAVLGRASTEAADPAASTSRSKSPTAGPPDLEVACGPCPAAPGCHTLYRFDFADADADCRFGCDEAGWLLEMAPRNGSTPCRVRMPYDRTQARCTATPAHHPALFRFGVWLLYNLAALRHGAVAIHASTIQWRGRGVLFLGESGTGKSTHTRLWCETIPGAELLNDDSPILRVAEGAVRIFGSPWSGKVPCYRNESVPVAAVVRLEQGPCNAINRLTPLEAIGALLPSAPPAFAHDERLQDAVCELLSQVIARVPVYRLVCRPEAQAVRLVYDTLFPEAPRKPEVPR